MKDRPDEELRRALERAERELVAKLEEPCELVPDDPGEEPTSHLLHLEDTLLAAARAAERVIELRRRCRDSGLTAQGERVLREAEMPVEPASESVREFTGPDGSPWRVWAVKPGAARAGSVAQRFLAEYREGWLAFESLDGSSRRRRPGIPSGWAQRPESSLRELFATACPAKPRRPTGEAGHPAPGMRQPGPEPRQAEGAAG